MDKRRPGRPPREYPYVCGPYKHRGRWRIIIVTGRRSGGRRQSYDRYADTREYATAWIRQFRQQRAAAGRSVQDAIDAYVEFLKRKGNKTGSIATAKYRLAALLDGQLALIDLNQRRAQEMYDDLVDEGVAVDTHRGCLVSGRAFGKFCQLRGWLSSNPFAAVLPVGRKAKGKEQLRTDEARVFMHHCLKAWHDSRDRGAIAGLLLLVFSARASEVAQLVARDVDDRGRVLRLGEHDIKTAAARRSARVPTVLVPVLLELADAPATAEGHLFARESGKPADRHWVAYHARAAMGDAGVTVVTAHGLRGTSATIGTVSTRSAEVMADALGHTSTKMTKDHYIDADAVSDARADAMTELLTDDDSAGTK